AHSRCRAGHDDAAAFELSVPVQISSPSARIRARKRVVGRLLTGPFAMPSMIAFRRSLQLPKEGAHIVEVAVRTEIQAGSPSRQAEINRSQTAASYEPWNTNLGFEFWELIGNMIV